MPHILPTIVEDKPTTIGAAKMLSLRSILSVERLRRMEAHPSRVRADLIMVDTIVHSSADTCCNGSALADTSNLHRYSSKLERYQGRPNCGQFFFAQRICELLNALLLSVVSAATTAQLKILPVETTKNESFELE